MAEIPQVEFGVINQEYEKQLLDALKHNQNLVNTAGKTTTDNFERVASEAFTKVQSGRLTPDQAIREATQELTANGVLKVEYPSGRKVNIRSALATNVRSTSKRVAMGNSLILGEQLNADHYEVSAHGDCAPDHLWLNGIVVKADSKELDDVINALQRPNCRHYLSPFWQGYSQKNDYGLPDEETIRHNYQERQERNKKQNVRNKATLERYVKAYDNLKLEDEFVGKSVEQVEQIIRKREYETMVAFDEKGKALYSKKGELKTVNLTREEKVVVRRYVHTITHNHPLGSNEAEGGTFSLDDLQWWSQLMVKHLRVADTWEKYELILTDESDLSDIKNVYNRVKNEQMPKIKGQIPLGINHNDYAFIMRKAKNDIIRQVAKECGIIYKKVG